MTAADGALEAPPGVGAIPLCGVDSTAAAGSFLDEDELVSLVLAQPQRATTRPINTSRLVFVDVNLSRIRKPPLGIVILEEIQSPDEAVNGRLETLAFDLAPPIPYRFG
jgi:hypothetical protein